jgi:Tfp pilus assembly protein PilV
MSGEAGFTIVETLVAALLLLVGALALIGTAASIPLFVDAARHDNRVSALATSELERLRLQACAGIRPGERMAGARSVSWDAETLPGDVVRVTVIVKTEIRRRARIDTLGVSVAC